MVVRVKAETARVDKVVDPNRVCIGQQRGEVVEVAIVVQVGHGDSHVGGFAAAKADVVRHHVIAKPVTRQIDAPIDVEHVAGWEPHRRRPSWQRSDLASRRC